MKKLLTVIALTSILLTGCGKKDTIEMDEIARIELEQVEINDYSEKETTLNGKNWNGVEWSKVKILPIVTTNSAFNRSYISRDVEKEHGFSEDSIKKIIVIDTKVDSEPKDYVYSWDISEEQNNSVKAWVVKNLDGSFDLYYGGEYGIIIKGYTGIFEGFDICTEISGLNKVNTSIATDFSSLFEHSKSLKKLDLSTWDFSNVEYMSRMFMGCTELEEINFEGVETPNLTYMYSMFDACENLKSVNLKDFDTDNLKGISRLFANCTSLKSIDLSNFNTEKITDMDELFFNCKSLESVNLKNFETRNVESMNNMFANCTSLKTLDLQDFETSSLKEMYAMFYNCKELAKLKIDKFDTQKVIGNGRLFEGCTKLDNSKDLFNFNKDELIKFGCETNSVDKDRDGQYYCLVSGIYFGEISVGDVVEIIDETGTKIEGKVKKLNLDFTEVNSLHSIEDNFYKSKWIYIEDINNEDISKLKSSSGKGLKLYVK